MREVASSTARSRSKQRRRSQGPAGPPDFRTRLMLAMIGILGMLLTLYPATASWFKQWQQSELVNLFTLGVDQMSIQQRAEEFARAVQYNDELTAGAAYDPFTQRLGEAGSEPYNEYLGILSGFPAGLMGRIRIPEIDVDLPIYHGTTEDVLLEGVGHLYGTALPVGGAGTHSVLTAHSGLASAVLFTNLHELEVGDTWTLDVSGETLTYQVISVETIEPNETESLAPEEGRDLMTLVTCTPIGINTHRLLVTGERIPTPPDVAAEPQMSELPRFPWWIVGDVVGLTIAGLYVAFGGRERKRDGTVQAPPSGTVDLAS